MEANTDVGIKNTHSWDGFLHLHHKLQHQMSELLLRAVLDLYPLPRPEMEPVKLFHFPRPAELSYQGNLI